MVKKLPGLSFSTWQMEQNFSHTKRKLTLQNQRNNPLYKTLEPIYNRVCIKSVYRNMCYQNSMFLNFITYDCNHLYLYFSYLYFGAFCSLQSLKRCTTISLPKEVPLANLQTPKVYKPDVIFH